MRAFLFRLVTLSRRFSRSGSGTAAIEFAIILPLALIIYVGGAVVADGVMTSRKINTITRTTVDLLSRQPTSFQATSTPVPSQAIDPSTLSAMFAAAGVLLSPAPTAPLAMTLSAIDITNQTNGVCCSVKVRWSFTQNGVLRPCNVQLTPAAPSQTPSATTISNALLPTGTALPSSISILIADVRYTYQPVLPSPYLKFAPPMTRTEYMMPRTTGQVVVSGLPTTGSQTGAICY